MTNWLESEEKEMTNWLESEENKISNRLKHEGLIHNNLKKFYDLCNRVNNVRNGSLAVGRLGVTSLKDIYNYLPGQVFNEPYNKRNIKFRYVEPDCYYLDLFIMQSTVYTSRDNADFTTTNEIILFTKKIEMEDLIKWNETSILNFIKWLIVETDSAKENLPGLFNTSVVFDFSYDCILRIKKLKDDLILAQSNLNEIEGWVFGRSSTEKENQLKVLNNTIDSIKNWIKSYETPSKVFLY